MSDTPEPIPDDGRHQAVRELLGAYVLGQLDDHDSDLVDAHLAGCAACRTEVSELLPVARALQPLRSRLPDRGVPPAELQDRVVGSVLEQRRRAARRTRRYRVLGALAAAAAVVIAFGIGVRVGPGVGAPPVRPVTLSTAPGITAEAGLVKHTWGTELKLGASGLTDGTVYTVEFVRDDGQHVPAGGIIGTGSATLTCSVNAAVPIDDAAELLVTGPDGVTVLSADLD